MHGLIVDPGASAPLMGTDTLKDYINDCLEPSGREVSFKSTTKTFVGIDGVPEPGIAQAQLPLGIPIMGNVTLDIALIGKAGSKCPGLLPLSTLLTLQAALLCNVLEDNGGILVLRVNIKNVLTETHYIRLYLTVSYTHLTLPTKA